MNGMALVLSCLCAAGASAESTTPRFAATLPNGVTVELVGVSFHSLEKRSQPAQWWRPDGSDLPNEAYRRPRSFTTHMPDECTCEFALRVTGAEEYSCAAFNWLGKSNVQPDTAYDANDKPIPGLRSFVCHFKNDQFTDTIRIGVSTAPWEPLDRWKGAWDKFEPEGMTVDSEKALVFTWPRKEKRGAVIVEITHRYGDEATRLLLYDRDGKVHEDTGHRHGKGTGLEKRIYWYWDLPLENIDRFEFQKRPYEWVEFRNVSLQPGKRTNVEVVVQGAYAEMGLTGSVTAPDRQDLGYLLDRLAAHLRFPAAGLARYRIEERSSLSAEPRFLQCVYAFRGPLYAFETMEGGQSDLRQYFDGRSSYHWAVRDNTAEVWEGQRQHRPIYRLDRFCPTGIMDDLAGHDVEFRGRSRLTGVPCSLLGATLSSKDRLRVWVAEEPNQFPLRIERYEHDHLIYLYEAENLRTWNGIVFPERIREAYYRWDDARGAVLLGSQDIVVASFEPNRHPALEAFQPQFSPAVSVTRHESPVPNVAAFEPTPPARRLSGFEDMVTDFRPEQAKGKRLLFCFFDLAQRPSRHCFTQLARQAGQLERSGVVVVGIEAAQADKDALESWLAEQDIRVPTGRVTGDIEQVKSSWGVRALPWLVLTDANHIVMAEGFALSALDEKLGVNAEKETE